MAEKDNDVFWRVALKNPRVNSLSANSRGMLDLPCEIKVHESLPSTCRRHITAQQFSDLVKLNLKSNQLSSLPLELAGLKKLKELNLGNNLLPTIPGVLAELESLLVLYLFNNRIETLDSSVLSRLPRLQAWHPELNVPA